jgi:hypothetical protein
MAAGFKRGGVVPEQLSAAELDKLHSKIGQLVVEQIFWRMPRTACSGSEAKNGEQRSQNERSATLCAINAVAF